MKIYSWGGGDSRLSHILTVRQEITALPRPELSKEVKERLMRPNKFNSRHSKIISETTYNPSVPKGKYTSAYWPNENGNGNGNGNGEGKKGFSRRYFATVEDTGDWPPELFDYNKRFAETLNTIKRRHDGVVTTVAQGILEYKRKRQRMQIDHNIQAFLDRFYMSRIGIRMLIGQHIALTDQNHNKDPNYVGIICTKTNVRDLAQEAIENARFVCEDFYGLFDAPKVQLVCPPDLNFMYVPGHLSHMLFETLKNSLRAVVETHGQDKEEFPITKVVVAEGKEDITIKISDEGGGIPRSAIPLVWTYMYTTVDSTPSLDPDFDKSDFKAPMAGFGYGLPISRLYARYFGGDLKLISMEGYVLPSFHPPKKTSPLTTPQLRHRRVPASQPPVLLLRTAPVTTNPPPGDRRPLPLPPPQHLAQPNPGHALQADAPQDPPRTPRSNDAQAGGRRGEHGERGRVLGGAEWFFWTGGGGVRAVLAGKWGGILAACACFCSPLLVLLPLLEMVA